MTFAIVQPHTDSPNERRAHRTLPRAEGRARDDNARVAMLRFQSLGACPRNGWGAVTGAAVVAATVLAAAVLATSCARVEQQEPAPQAVEEPAASLADTLDPGAVDLIDLGWPLSPEGLYWPTGSPFEHEVTAGMSDGGYWYASGTFSSPEHLGTHLDAPLHFGEGRWTSAQIPLERLLAPGVVIDISAAAEESPDALLTPGDIESWEQRNGAFAAGSIVLVRSGWDARWPDANAYYGTETPGDVSTLHFPGVSPQAAELLVDRGIAGVGIDTASIDPGTSVDFRAHQILADANIYNLENLTGLGALPETGFFIVAMPMKIAGGTGGPARVIALVPR